MKLKTAINLKKSNKEVINQFRINYKIYHNSDWIKLFLYGQAILVQLKFCHKGSVREEETIG